ncbi:hypothetical protein Celaphus_00007268 [Cervus elaphus hippelaphus]|uniref:Uncharacterized protein n=1 Tax=Cervus elaphus hippelaphus TaxID=46360 RepID=A0A212CYP5_CEREH|nr:hypothetical protein Celaphus_00007268 [Cervus elaphus hippelaphus]
MARRSITLPDLEEEASSPDSSHPMLGLTQPTSKSPVRRAWKATLKLPTSLGMLRGPHEPYSKEVLEIVEQRIELCALRLCPALCGPAPPRASPDIVHQQHRAVGHDR